MEILQNVINILLLVAAILLVIVVLLQESNNSGLGSAFGSETTSLTSRGKKASRERQLQKITVILAIAVAVFAILMVLMPWFEKLAAPAKESADTMLDLVRSIF